MKPLLWGGPDQPDFLNAAVEIETTLSEIDLLNACLDVENDMGRVRKERWGQRNIDIDILFYNRLIMESEVLTIPHPFMHTRGFVLQPLSDIAPDFIHPVLGKTVDELKNRVSLSGMKRMDDIHLDL